MATEGNLARDIDYAAIAVKKAIQEKFGRQNNLDSLEILAGDKTIFVRDGDRQTEGTRDDLLAGIRAATDYADVWVQWRR
ncbi:MAG TPA: hypothetical protein VHX65_20620 [Pirellulales bacterium]|jgi:hypothetical protein|nr:hypothetical protein [Pirellulales bacterium]